MFLDFIVDNLILTATALMIFIGLIVLAVVFFKKKKPLQDEDAPLPFVQENAVYDRSFRARLSQSEEDLKQVYSLLKNQLLCFENAYSHIGWDYDTIRLGRPTIAKFAFKGKALVLYFALDINDYSDKNLPIESSKILPLMVRLTTKKRIDCATNLIEDLRVKLNANKIDNFNDYTLPYQTDEDLLSAGLIKITANGKVSEVIKQRQSK